VTKIKYRNKLEAGTDTRLQLSVIIPDLKLTRSFKQPHPLH